MQKIKLTLSNRIYIPTLFPEKGNFETSIIVKDILKKIRVTQEEITTCGIKTEIDDQGTQTITWSNAKVIEVEFTKLELAFLTTVLIEKNNQKELQFDFDTLNLYSQIVFNKELE